MSSPKDELYWWYVVYTWYILSTGGYSSLGHRANSRAAQKTRIQSCLNRPNRSTTIINLNISLKAFIFEPKEWQNRTISPMVCWNSPSKVCWKSELNCTQSKLFQNANREKSCSVLTSNRSNKPIQHWIYVRMYVRTYVRTYVCPYLCPYLCAYVRMYIRMNDCTYVYEWMNVRTYQPLSVSRPLPSYVGARSREYEQSPASRQGCQCSDVMARIWNVTALHAGMCKEEDTCSHTI